MDSLKNKGLKGLAWLGGYFETDMLYVAKSGFWLTLGQISGALLAFGLSVFFANYISKDIYGNYKFVLSITGILGALSLTGMGNVVVQSVARGKEGTLKEAVKATLWWGLIILVVGVISSIYYFLKGNTILGFSMVIASIATPLTNAFALYGGYFSGKKNFKLSTLYWLISQILINAGIIIVAVMTQNILALVFIYFAVTLGVNCLGFIRVISKYTLNNEVDNEMMTYGKHVSFMNFFSTIANQLDKILVFHYLGAINLAIYSFSQAIPEQIKGAFKNLFNIAIPKYAVLPDADLRKSILKKTRQLTFIASGLVLGYILLSPFIFKIFFPKYTDAVFYSQIYMLGLIAIPGISLFATYFQIKKATKTMYKLTVLSNITTIILTITLIYNFGLKGAVIENGISWFIMLSINYYFFSTHREN
jgi:O-antigen/teichoic acid export membrane protein